MNDSSKIISTKKKLQKLSPAKRLLLEKKLREKKSYNPISSSEKDLNPLSFAQERQWVLDKLLPKSPLYNVFRAWEILGKLNIPALTQSLEDLFERHTAVRMHIQNVDGTLYQAVSDTPLPFEIVDISSIPDNQEESVKQILQDFIQLPFDLRKPPAIRILLIKVSDKRHHLCVVFHHIASDGWSRSVFTRDLSRLYNARLSQQEANLPKLTIQYSDYAVWQRQWLKDGVFEKQLGYWKKYLSDLPVLELPTSYPRPAEMDYNGNQQAFELPKPLYSELKRLSQNNSCTLFMTLLSSFMVLLMRYANQEDFAVGTPIAGRSRPELENLIGFFVNSLVLRSDLSGNPSFLELLKRTRQHTLAAFNHQDLPFEKLVEALNPDRDLSRHPLFQVMFALQNQPPESLSLEQLQTETLELYNQTAKFDLSFTLTETDNAINGQVEYATSLFSQSRIEQMMAHWLNLLQAIVTQPDTTLWQLPLMNEGERQKILVDWNRTQQDYPQDTTLQQLFEQQVERTPQAVAVITENGQLTYDSLNRQANQLAHYLQSIGVGPDKLVGICVERSLEMMVGLLAILKAGGAYLPLDPEYPDHRLAFMIEDAKPVALLAGSEQIMNLPKVGHSLCLDTDQALWNRFSTDNPATSSQPQNLVYVIYTSGSTGKPKGVLIQQHAIVNYVFWMLNNFQFTPNDKILIKSPISFDASASELYAPLMCGAQLVIAKDRGEKDTGYLTRLIQQHQVTVLQLVPSLLQAMIYETDFKNCTSLTRIFCGGEALSSQLVKACTDNLDATLYNVYGPTEATIDATWKACSEAEQDPVSIGRPISNATCYVLDRFNNPVPVGTHGELHVGGKGIAQGYLNRPELTDEKFIDHPFLPGERLYRTGDLASYREDGLLDFHGRIDHQVKLRGYRIETGEIEARLKQHTQVTEVTVIVWEKTATDKHLVAYVVTDTDQLTSEQLRDHLKADLPEYMIPSFFVLLEQMPLTPNGKIDRKALPEPVHEIGDEDRVAPRTETEKQLARIWQDVLSLDNISINDNFFALGGHSLLAMELTHKAEKLLDCKLPVMLLFEHPTIAEYANGMAQFTDIKKTTSTLLEIQPHGSKRPLFYIGSTNNARKLSPLLDQDQPVYGLNIFGTEEASDPDLPVSIDSIATQFLDDIQKIQPSGPYQFAAYCADTPIAYEIAQKIFSNDDAVSVFVTIDTVWKTNQHHVRNEQHIFNNVRQLSFKNLVNKILRKSSRKINRLFTKLQNNTSSQKSTAVQITQARHRQFYSRFQQALDQYQASANYPGKMVSILSKESYEKNETSGLENYIADKSDLSTFVINGLHDTFFEEPYIHELIDIINQHLE